MTEPPARGGAARTESVLAQAAQLHAKALIEQNNVHPMSALRTLRRALNLLEANPAAAATDRGEALAAAIWITQAFNVAEVHGLERALDALSQAQRRADRVDDPALRVRVHGNHAWMAARAGLFDRALAEFASAMALLEHADPPDQFGVLLNSGNLHLFRGELDEARGLLRRAVAVAERNDMAAGQFMALHNVGYVDFLAGDLPQALRSMEAAAQLSVDVSRGISLLDRARVLVEAGLSREADDALAQAARIFAQDRLGQDLGEVEVSRAECALLEADTAAARRFATRARDRFRRRGNERWRRTAELILLQGDLAAGRPGARLAPVALRLAEQLRADGLSGRAASAALVAAEALIRTGRVEEAGQVLRSTARAARTAPIAVRLHARYVRAQLDAASGQPVAAQRQARLGLAELAGYQASFGAIDLRTASAVHGRRLAELDVAVAVERAVPAGVLAAIERGRAVSSRLPAVRPPADERAASLLQELRQVIESIRAEQGDDTRLQSTRRELERQLKARSWTLPGAGDVVKAATPAAIRAGVADADASLVAYVRVGDRLLAVVVGSRGARLHELGGAAVVEDLIRRVRADLDVLAHSTLPGGLVAAAQGSLTRSLAGLDATLLGPLALDDRRLVIIPTGILGVLPWNLLPSRRGVPVVVSPSATAWLAGCAGSSVLRDRSMVAIAGPDLSRAQDEVTAIAAIDPRAIAIFGAEANGAALTAAMASASIVHVAAHGSHQVGNPLFSSLRLGDGPLFAHELTHTAPHVVLSACDLGLATVRPGDEALGLSSVLLHLGTRSVVSGVARVSDAAAAEAMVSYHQLLRQGRDSAEALAAAVAGSPAPLPFVCFGAQWSIRTGRT